MSDLLKEHQTEIAALLKQAGFDMGPCNGDAAYGWIIACRPGSEEWDLRVEIGQRSGWCDAHYIAPCSDPLAIAGHADPRVALRACLEMAGLLEDRPPLTTDELDAWLRANHGAPEDRHVPTWMVRGKQLERFDDEWCYRGTMVPARDIGIMVWGDKKFAAVKP